MKELFLALALLSLNVARAHDYLASKLYYDTYEWYQLMRSTDLPSESVSAVGNFLQVTRAYMDCRQGDDYPFPYPDYHSCYNEHKRVFVSFAAVEERLPENLYEWAEIFRAYLRVQNDVYSLEL